MKKLRTSIDQESLIVESLPLLDYLNEQYQIDRRKPFSNYKIFAVQHLLGSTVPLFSLLTKGGTTPENIYIVGKAYSSHPSVVNYFIKHNYQISKKTFDFVEDQPYDKILEYNIHQSFKKLIADTDFSSDNKRGLIIDDGGKAIKILYEHYPQLAYYFSGVEQTSRGARVVQNLPLISPIINVARSDTKTRIESPLIAQSMVDEFLLSLQKWRDLVMLSNSNVFMLGYGFIGENVAKLLNQRGFSVTVYDPDIKKLTKAKMQGNTILRERFLGYTNAATIVGCSGTSAIPLEEYVQIRKNTLLVNMASTDIEFNAWNLRKNGTVVHEHRFSHDSSKNDHPLPLPWRCLYKINEGNTSFFLANGGFPIDFSGSIDPIDPQKIQLTRGLLLGAALQAVNTSESGFINLNQSLQKNIVKKYLQLQKL